MSKIVLCSREWSDTTGRYVRELVKQLELIDHVNEYIVMLKPKDMDKWTPSQPNFHKVVCQHRQFSFAEQTALKKQLEELSPDLVHFTMVQQPVLYKGPVITTMHDLITLRFKNPSKNVIVFTIKQWVYGWVNKVAARKSRFVITPTNFVKNDVINYTGVAADKIKVTYESATLLNQAASPIKSLLGKQFIMYIGRPNPHKNLPRVIEAFLLLKKTHPNLMLVLAGKLDPVYNQIKHDVEQRNLSDIFFTDFITDGQLKWLYSNTSAYVFPSLSEGFGLPALEAMAHGAPVVSSNTSCSPEVYGDAPLYFDPLNVTDMADKIGQVLDNPQRKEQLIKKGKQQAAKYSWRRMAEQTLALYTDALAAKDK